MTWFKQCLIATSSLLALMVLLVLADAMKITAQSGQPPGPTVTVVNTDANPVPVTAATPLPVIGSVNLGGTPTVTLSPGATVKARQAGEWNVDIDACECHSNALRPLSYPTAPWKALEICSRCRPVTA